MARNRLDPARSPYPTRWTAPLRPLEVRDVQSSGCVTRASPSSESERTGAEPAKRFALFFDIGVRAMEYEAVGLSVKATAVEKVVGDDRSDGDRDPSDERLCDRHRMIALASNEAGWRRGGYRVEWRSGLPGGLSKTSRSGDSQQSGSVIGERLSSAPRGWSERSIVATVDVKLSTRRARRLKRIQSEDKVQRRPGRSGKQVGQADRRETTDETRRKG